ncbi:MAG: hypothetical protein R6T90_09305, partial [Dissulfuribacterales bacterium]
NVAFGLTDLPKFKRKVFADVCICRLCRKFPRQSPDRVPAAAKFSKSSTPGQDKMTPSYYTKKRLNNIKSEKAIL